MRTFLILLIGSFLILSCQPSQSRLSESYHETLQVNDTLLLELDEESPLELPGIHIANLGKEKWLCYFNPMNSFFYFKQWSSNKPFTKIFLGGNGSQSVGPKTNIGVTLSRKGIVVYNPDIYTLFLLDSKEASILQKWKLNPDDVEISGKYAPAMVTDGRSIHILQDSLVVISGYVGYRTKDYTQTFSQTIFNLNQKDVNYFGAVPYPLRYNLGNWGKFSYYMTDACTLYDSLIAVNFPLMDSIFLAPVQNPERIFSIGMKSFTSNLDDLSPLPVAADKRYDDKQEEQYFDFINQQYKKIFYDQLNDVFIRIFRSVPVKRSEIEKSGGKFWKGATYSLSVFDKSGSYIGMTDLPADYYSFMHTFLVNGKLYFIPLPAFQPKEAFLELHMWDIRKNLEKWTIEN